MRIAGSLAFAPRWGVEAYAAALGAGGTPPRVALVAEDAVTGRVCGFVLGFVIAPEAELESIGVDLAAQWQGIGRALLEAWSDEVRLVGAEQIVLEVRDSNLAGRRLYESSGFAEVGRRPAYYSGPVEDAVLLRSVLD